MGSGKTFTATNVCYRLVKHADARRILFLVDRANLGRRTLKEFQGFTTPDDGPAVGPDVMNACGIAVGRLTLAG